MKINYKEKKLLENSEATETELQFAIQDTNLQLQSDILATQKELAKSDKNLEDLKSSYPFPTEKYIQEKENNQSLKHGLETLKALQKEFGFTR